jgi:putative peptidoglycan lipid II flippase
VLLGWEVWHVIDGALGRSLGAQLLSVGAAVAAATAAYLAAAQAFEMRELRALGQLRRPPLP